MGENPVVLFTASTCSHIFNFHLPYLKEFHRLGWKVHVACGTPISPLPEADRVIPLLFEKKMHSLQNFRAMRVLRKEIEGNGYALVITHTALAAFFTRLAVKGMRNRPPVVNVVHGYLFDDETPYLKRRLLMAAEKIMARQTDLLLAMNAQDFMIAQKQALAKNISSIPGMGVDFSKLRRYDRSATDDLRLKYGLDADDFLLLYAAEFSERKNQIMLIEALLSLPNNVKLMLPGAGKLWERCYEFVLEHGLQDRVIMPGYSDNISLWYSLTNAVVSASRSEGLPFNIMEAMYFKLPVVASHVKGHTNLILDMKTGILFPFNDKKAFAEAIIALLGSKELRAQLGAAARQFAEDFSVTAVMPKVMEKYLSVL